MMTRVIDKPIVSYHSDGFTVKGRKYKIDLVERGIFNPIKVELNVTEDDQPLFLSEIRKIEMGIHRAITRNPKHDEFIWIFNKDTNPLVDDIGYLSNEMMALRILNKDMRL